MIREDSYGRLKEQKGEGSFSDVIDKLVRTDLETRRRNLRLYFGVLGGKEYKELERSVMEVLKVAKGRLF